MRTNILIAGTAIALVIPAMLMVLSLGTAPVHAEAGAHALYDGAFGLSETCFVKPHNADNSYNNGRGFGNAWGADDGAMVSIHSLSADMSGICNVCGSNLENWMYTKVHPLAGDGTITGSRVQCDA